MQWVWLAALIGFLILEACTSALVSVWFVGGALVSLIASLCSAPLWLQIVLFVAVSAALLMSLRPFAKKILSPVKTVTNARSNIGKIAVVTETIDNLHGKGAVKIGGIFWSARSTAENVIEEGALVRIVEIEGAKVCVECAEEKQEVFTCQKN